MICSTADCGVRFGITRQAAHALGTQGIVVGPQGWAPFFARHELIHHVQMEHLGSLCALAFTPEWFIEGVGCSLSENPRSALPAPMQGWRALFDAWNPGIASRDFWALARRL